LLLPDVMWPPMFFLRRLALLFASGFSYGNDLLHLTMNEAMAQARLGANGFSSPHLLVDGFPYLGLYNRDWFNFAAGSPEASQWRTTIDHPVSLRLKQAQRDSRQQVGVELGAIRQRITADMGANWAESAAMRLNVQGTIHDAGRSAQATQSIGIAPSFAWGLGSNSELHASLLYLHREGASDYGMPFDPRSGRPYDAPYDHYYGLADVDCEQVTTYQGLVRFVHTESEQSRWLTRFSYSAYDYFSNPTEPMLLLESGKEDVVMRKLKQRTANDDVLNLAQKYEYEFNWGTVAHQASAELLLRRERMYSRRDTAISSSLPPDTPAELPDPYPDYSPMMGPMDRREASGWLTTFDVQDRLKLSSNLQLELGAKVDQIRQGISYQGFDKDTGESTGSYDFTRQLFLPSWQAALNWQASDALSWHLRMGQTSNTALRTYIYDEAGRDLPAELSNYRELGLIWRSAGLALQANAYQLDKYHERNAGAAVRGVALLSKHRRDQGVDLRLGLVLSPQLKLSAYGNGLNALIMEAGDIAGTAGNRPRNTPNYLANLAVKYQINPQWRSSLGINWVGQRSNNEKNAYQLPAYHLLSARVQYRGKNSSLSLVVNNVFDSMYYEGRYRDSAAVGAPRNIALIYSIGV
jgi:catecholate siderophore receptor